MERDEINPKLALAFDVLGKRWNGLIIAALGSGLHHFNDILETIPQLHESMLSKRLKELIKAGIVTRCVSIQESISIEYHLTDKGRGLQPALEKLYEWVYDWE